MADRDPYLQPDTQANEHGDAYTDGDKYEYPYPDGYGNPDARYSLFRGEEMTFESCLHARNDIWSFEGHRTDMPKFRHVKQALIILATYQGDPNQAYHLTWQAKTVQMYRDAGLRLVFRSNIPPWEPHRKVIGAWLPVLLSVTKPGEKIQLGNEPNNPGENWGGPDVKVARAFNDYFPGLIEGFRKAVPDRLWGFPGLAVMQNDTQWLLACNEAVRAADWLGMHVYWQHGNVQDPAWGQRYRLLAPLAPSETPILITEYGDSTPGRSAVAKAEWYKVWLLELQLVAKLLGIEAAFAFIASSPDPQWREFEITEEAAALLELPDTEEPEEEEREEETLEQDLMDQYREQYETWVYAGGIENNFRAHLLGQGLLKPTADDLRMLIGDIRSSLGQLEQALDTLPFE